MPCSRRSLLRQAGLLGPVLALRGSDQPGNDWIRNCRGVILEAYNYPFYPKYQYSPEKAVEIALAVRANAIRYPAASFFAYFPTRTRYPVEPAIRVGDPMARTIELAHQAGLKVIVYIPVNAPFMEVNSSNPDYQDWMKRTATGEPMPDRGVLGYGNFFEGCMNSPLRSEILGMVREVAGRYAADAIYLDGPYAQGLMRRAPCCCRYCREAYRKASGKEVPADAAGAEEYREWYLWVRDVVAAGMMHDMVQTIRGLRDIPVLFNNTGLLTRDCRARLYPELDGFMFEAADTPEQKLFNLQVGQSTGKTIWTYISGYHRGWFGYPVEGEELLLDGAFAFAAGAGTVYWAANRFFDLPRDPLSYAAGRYLRQIHEFAAAHQTIVRDLGPAPQAGILVSTQTVSWYPGLDPSYRNCYYGAYELLKGLCFDAEPFLDHRFSAETLSKYPLVYLPMAFCLSSEQCAALGHYVESGGALIATHLTSIADEAGRRRNGFGLADLLGIRLKAGEPVRIPDLYVRPRGGGELVPQDAQAVLFETAGAEVVAETVDRARDALVGPAITQRRYGRGYAIYIGSSPETAYRTDRLQALRPYFQALLAPFLEKHRTYSVNYHAGLTPHLVRSGRRIVLHLLANAGSRYNSNRAPEQFVALEQIGVRIRVPAGKRVRAVRLLCAGGELAYSVENGWAEMTIPRVRIHEAVDLELA